MVYHLLPRYLVSADLAQTADWTAVTVLERTPERLSAEGSYELIHLQRWRNEPYTVLPGRLRAIIEQTQMRWSTLAAARGRALPMTRAPIDVLIDMTGCGRPVFDYLCAEGLPVVGISIHGGQAVVRASHAEWHTPKKDLVGAVQLLLQTRRLQWRPELPGTEVLQAELRNFRATIAASGHTSFGAGVVGGPDDWRDGGAHDDTVLSIALGAWYGERGVEVARRSAVFVRPYADFARDPDDEGEDGLDPAWVRQLTAVAVAQRKRNE